MKKQVTFVKKPKKEVVFKKKPGIQGTGIYAFKMNGPKKA